MSYHIHAKPHTTSPAAGFLSGNRGQTFSFFRPRGLGATVSSSVLRTSIFSPIASCFSGRLLMWFAKKHRDVCPNSELRKGAPVPDKAPNRGALISMHPDRTRRGWVGGQNQSEIRPPRCCLVFSEAVPARAAYGREKCIWHRLPPGPHLSYLSLIFNNPMTRDTERGEYVNTTNLQCYVTGRRKYIYSEPAVPRMKAVRFGLT
ncbi:hypothetical protein F4778DRAFT_356768 [Xylariomycetidae sp. FL2044]|nr:hypothetical protein F4778DRAFT_356768 [Xylariomycetidae sp. FL2044]